MSSGSQQLVDSASLATAAGSARLLRGAQLIYVAAGAQFTNIGPSNVASKTSFFVRFDPANPTLVTLAHQVIVTTAFNTNGTIKTPATAGGIGNNYSAGDITGKFICQKCHKLVNPYQGISADAGIPGTAVQNSCNACNTGTGTHSPASTEGIPNGYPKSN